jgi:hypothetical protein
LTASGIAANEIQTKTKGHTITLTFPEVWSVRDAPDEVAKFFNELNKAIFVSCASRVIIDHKALRIVSPDGVLVLIAELYRITTYAPKAILEASFGAPPKVMAVLHLAGYLRYFNVIWDQCDEEKRIFLRETHGIGSVAEESAKVVKAFTESGYLGNTEGKWLGKGLIECMDNACEHAYNLGAMSKLAIHRRLRKNWWLLGYTDPQNSEIAFAFFDQGVGMPNTLRFKPSDRVREFLGGDLLKRSDEELIIEAFTRSFSRTKDPNRGVGLPPREFVAEATIPDAHKAALISWLRSLDGKRNSVRLTWDKPGHLTLTLRDSDTTDALIHVPVSITGLPPVIAFAPGYLADALTIGPTLRLIDGISPGMASSPSGNFCVLMPQRCVTEDAPEVDVKQAKAPAKAA